MSPRYPGHNPNPFQSAELGGLDLPPEEMAAHGQLARDLEALADRGTVRPSPDFADRVMSAIASEPVPAPLVAAGSAVRRLSLAGLLGSVRDAARVAFGPGFPAAARLQGLSLVLVAALTVGGATVGAAGALGLFNGQQDGPRVTPVPTQLVAPTPSPTQEPAQTAEPTPTQGPIDSSFAPDATGTPDASEAPDTSEAPDSPEPTDTAEAHSGSGTSGGGSYATPRPTPRPTSAPTPTPSPTHHEDGGGEHSPSPSPMPTPTPSATGEG